jgi:TetR/AcrR family transcriptional regulator, regulator of cefoperazone and chloramphenicol sensitivity
MRTLNTAPEMMSERAVRARIRDVAIEQFGQHGFDAELYAVAEAAGVNAELLIHEFGSIEGLRKACDDYILESIRTAKSESLQSMSPATWFAQLAQIESYAPMMNYLVGSMVSGGDLGRALMVQMIDNAESYIEDAVRAGTIKPSHDPKARARFLAMSGGGGFLLYLHMHDNPTDMEAVLRDYSKDMILPALELYTHGLLTDTSMYDAFVAREEAREESKQPN